MKKNEKGKERKILDEFYPPTHLCFIFRNHRLSRPTRIDIPSPKMNLKFDCEKYKVKKKEEKKKKKKEKERKKIRVFPLPHTFASFSEI